MSAAESGKRGVKIARQARSHAMHAAILDASLAAIREKGPDGFTLADVVQRAQCTTGAVYGRFRDKEALLLALYEHLVEKWKTDLERGYESWTTGRWPLREGLRRLIAAQISVRRKDWTLRDAFLARILSQPSFRRASGDLMRASAELLADALSSLKEFRGVPKGELRRRTGLVTVVVGASLERAAAFRAEAPDYLPQTDDVLAEALCDIAEGILNPRVARRKAGGSDA